MALTPPWSTLVMVTLYPAPLEVQSEFQIHSRSSRDLVLSIAAPTLNYWILQRGDGFPSRCLWQLPYIPLITSVIFQSPSPGDSCLNSSLSPNCHPSPPLPPGLPSPLRGLVSPSPSPTHRASPHFCLLTKHPHSLRRSSQDPAYSLHSAGHLSPAHTQGLS